MVVAALAFGTCQTPSPNWGIVLPSFSVRYGTLLTAHPPPRFVFPSNKPTEIVRSVWHHAGHVHESLVPLRCRVDYLGHAVLLHQADRGRHRSHGHRVWTLRVRGSGAAPPCAAARHDGHRAAQVARRARAHLPG